MFFLFLLTAHCFAGSNQESDLMDLLANYRETGQWSSLKNELDKIIKREGRQADLLIWRLRAESFVNLDKPEEALEDIEIAYRKNPGTEDTRLLNLIACAAHIKLGDVDSAELEGELSNDQNIKEQVSNMKDALEKIEEATDNDDLLTAAKNYDRILPTCTHAYYFWQKRIELAWELGQMPIYEKYAEKLIEMIPDDAEMQFKYGIALGCDGKFGPAKKYIKMADEMDEPPENLEDYKKAFATGEKMIIKLRNSVNRGRFDEGYRIIDELNGSLLSVCTQNCGLSSLIHYLKAKLKVKDRKLEEAIQSLEKSVEIYPENQEYLLLKAETEHKHKDYDASIEDYQKLIVLNPNKASYTNALQRVQREKLKETRVDLYATLGVAKGSSLNQIKDAYRKLAMKWHPDLYSNKEEKRAAEHMMTSINKAYEVLSDKGKREYYDAGGDMDHYQDYVMKMNRRKKKMAGRPL